MVCIFTFLGSAKREDCRPVTPPSPNPGAGIFVRRARKPRALWPVDVAMVFLSLVRELRHYPRAVAAVTAVAVAIGLVAAFRVTRGWGSRAGARSWDTPAPPRCSTPRSRRPAGTAGGTTNPSREPRRAPRRPHDAVSAPRADRRPSRHPARAPAHATADEPPHKRLTNPEVSRATVEEVDREAYIMRVGVSALVEGASPIIGVDVRAPDPRAPRGSPTQRSRPSGRTSTRPRRAPAARRRSRSAWSPRPVAGDRRPVAGVGLLAAVLFSWSAVR